MNQTNKEIIKATREFRDVMTADTAIIEIAKMLSTSADRLDVTTAALREMTKKYVASVAAERVWEATMMEACGEDGPAAVASEIRSLRKLRDTALDTVRKECDALAAENAALKSGIGEAYDEMEQLDNGYFSTDADGEPMETLIPLVSAQAAIQKLAIDIETPDTDAFMAEVRASAIPEGYVLVPQEMHLSSEAMEGICFHCGDGDHQFGEFTDGTLFVGEVDYGDGKKVHGLHIATADYPEEGCTTICEFAAQLRQGAAV